MDVMDTTIVASLAGAVLFFLSGYLARGLRRHAASAADGRAALDVGPSSELRGRVETLQAALAERQQLCDQLRSEVDGLSAARQQQAEEGQRARAEVVELKRGRDQLGQEIEQLRAEGARAEQATRKAELLEASVEQLKKRSADLERYRSEASQLRARLKALEQELAQRPAAEEKTQVDAKGPDVEVVRKIAQLEADAKRLRGELGKLRSSGEQAKELRGQLATQKEQLERARSELKKLQGLSSRAAQADGLQLENEQLRQQLEQVSAESVPAAEVTKLRKKQRDMLVKAQMMQQRVTEMERHAQENTLLRQQLVGHEELVAEADQLREQIKKLQALVFSAGLDTRQQDGAEPLPKRESDLSRGTAMDHELDRLINSGKTRSAVLADSQGLMLASSGDGTFHEALAVLSGMIGQLGEQSTDMLPLGGLSRAELTDENGVLLASRLFTYGDQPLALTFVGTEANAPDPKVEELVASLTQIIDAEG